MHEMLTMTFYNILRSTTNSLSTNYTHPIIPFLTPPMRPFCGGLDFAFTTIGHYNFGVTKNQYFFVYELLNLNFPAGLRKKIGK